MFVTVCVWRCVMKRRSVEARWAAPERVVMLDVCLAYGLDPDAPREFEILLHGAVQGEVILDWDRGLWCVHHGNDVVEA